MSGGRLQTATSAFAASMERRWTQRSAQTLAADPEGRIMVTADGRRRDPVLRAVGGSEVISKAALILAPLLVAALAPAAAADPPANDAATGAAPFEVYTAVNGTPAERTATAELAEATPDPGVLPCLGAASFQRTVWYRIPATQTPRELTIEAAGRTLDVVDLAAFVQPGPGQTITKLPNVCAGAGVGGGDSAGDATSGLTIRVGAFRDVLVQVGRRGPVGSPDGERVQLSLAETALPVADEPDGDRADTATPSIPRG